MDRGAGLTGALLVTLASPRTWPLALAVFLLRGGLVLVALPIVVLPTPVGLGNLLAPTLTSLVFGGVSAGLVILVIGIALAGLAWVVAGGTLAAMLEAEAARIVAGHEEVAPPPGIRVPPMAANDLTDRSAPVVSGGRSVEAGRIFLARVLAHLPLGIALAWGSVRLVAITYHELTNPTDVATSIVWRVLREAPEVVVAIVLTWMVGQTLGAIAARRVALARSGTLGALRAAASTVLRQPVPVLLGFWLPTLALAVALAPSAVAASSAADVIRTAVATPEDPIGLFLAVVLFVSLWIVGLALTAVICAWRAAFWTVGLGEASR
jgi:hypothetical protein